MFRCVSFLAAALAFSVGHAHANAVEAHCTEITEAEGGDASGCRCLAEFADEDMTIELLQVETAEDIERLSAPSQDAIEACWAEG